MVNQAENAMTEFVVTDPTGKEHVVTAPEGATQEQALEYAKSQFGGTSGGAATGNPNIAAQGAAARSPKNRTSAGEVISTIAGAGAIGAAAGAASPEILTGLGAAASAYPIGRTLMNAGMAMRGAGRAAGAISGGVSGVGGATAEESALAAGASPGVAMGASLIGGFAPEIGHFAAMAAKRMLGAPYSAVIDWAKLNIEQKLGRKIDQREAEQLTRAIGEFRGQGGKPAMQDIYTALSDAAVRERRESAAVAGRLLAQGEGDANRVLEQTVKGPVSRIRDGADTLSTMADDFLRTARDSRFAIGRDVDESTIGNDLRGAIVKRNESLRQSRAQQYAADEKARNEIVTAREAAGERLDQMPEYQELLGSLRGKLLKGQKAQNEANGLAPVTEQGVFSAYEKIYEAVSGRRVQTGVNEAGEPTYKTFKTSFDALDDLRRRLGTVFTKQPAEGYEAINASTAREYYQKISDIQKKFAGGEGGPQERLLDNYAAGSEGLQQFMSKRGRKVTAMDRLDPERYATDAKALPNDTFRSTQGVRDAIELSGDRNLVRQAALDFSTTKLADKDAAGVRKFMTDYREMLGALPEVKKEVSEYALRLEKAEGRAANAQAGIKLLERREADATKQAVRIANDIRATAERNAASAVRTGDTTAKTLLGTREAVEQVRNLIEAGSREAWDVAGPAIAQSPVARAAVAKAVRETLAGRAETSVKGVARFFDDKVRPSLERTGLMSVDEANRIAAELTKIADLKVPEREKLGLGKRLVLQSVTAASATALSKGAVMGTGALAEMIPTGEQ